MRRGPVDFRLTEAAYKASPTLSLIMVRYLLDAKLGERFYTRDSEEEQWSVAASLIREPWYLPRHLRPLLDLHWAWTELYVSGKVEAGSLSRPLSSALERAWRLDDLELFQEICRVVLRRANTGLYRTGRPAPEATEVDERWKACFAFLEVLAAIERTLPRWVSAERRREARARISVGKALVDGETSWALFLALSFLHVRDSHFGVRKIPPSKRFSKHACERSASWSTCETRWSASKPCAP